MARFFALALVSVAFSLQAQTPLYNPDFNGDGYIGVDDLLALLSNFSAEWVTDSGNAVYGCTYPFYQEYDPLANTDDGSCATLLVMGCTDVQACNYDPDASIDNGTCEADADGDGLCDSVDACFGTVDACGVCNGPGAVYECGCADVPDCNCDCEGNVFDAIGECGGTCEFDVDGDGKCDDEDECVGTVDECGVCNGVGAAFQCGCDNIPAGDCDCNGTQVDALGVCGGTCAADADGDGICDEMDDCVGEFDACGVCNGPGEIYACGCLDIPEGNCDCDGNELDAIGVCGGTCTMDENADGICDLEVGCPDPFACNYDPSANPENACVYVANPAVEFQEFAWNYSVEMPCGGNGMTMTGMYVVSGNTLLDTNDEYLVFNWALCDETLTMWIPEQMSFTFHWIGESFVAMASENQGACATLTPAVFGCTESTAPNYNPSATVDDGSCPGCTYPLACNFNANAVQDDGSCEFQSCYGCTDPEACNFEATATQDDGGCMYIDTDEDGVCDEDEVAGCTDATACNYDPTATESYLEESGLHVVLTAGSWPFGILWTLDGDSYGAPFDGFIALAPGFYTIEGFDDGGWGAVMTITDDGSGTSYSLILTDSTASVDVEVTVSALACTYAPAYYDCDGNCLNDMDGDGVCDELEASGCTDESACNYDNDATDDDGSCVYASGYYDCDGNCLNDADGDGVCDALEVPGVTDPLFDCDSTDFNSCVPGCTLAGANNFNPVANFDDGSCFDCDAPISYQGYGYTTVLIGNQCWFVENLRSENYANGDVIPANLSDSEWSSTTFGAVAVYGEGSSTCSAVVDDVDACDEAWSLNEFGRLYNWYAVDDGRGLCPSGWHVPTDGEWMTMEMALGMSEAAANETLWRGTDQGTQMQTDYGSFNGTNSSGFSGLSAGQRNYEGNFWYAGYQGSWWSSSPNGNYAWYRGLSDSNEGVLRSSAPSNEGLSVRCVRDADFTVTDLNGNIYGCTDSLACSYNASATISYNGSCVYPGDSYDCDGSCQYADADADGICDDIDDCVGNYDQCGICNGNDACVGCTDATACNYNGATIDDGSCITDVNENGICDTEEGPFASCGDVLEYHGTYYATVEIGGRCWFKSNLQTGNYADGTMIPGNFTDWMWSNDTSGALAVYGEGVSDCTEYTPNIDACDDVPPGYGKLYNWYAVSHPGGLCPSGWHVPSSSNWNLLADSLGGADSAGHVMKTTSGWQWEGNGSNASGFDGLPNGRRMVEGNFQDAGLYAMWWTSDAVGEEQASYRYIGHSNPSLTTWQNDKHMGFGVRCIQSIEGCMNSEALNFNPDADIDDGTCAFCGDPWTYNGIAYETREINGLCWFAENLSTTAYANGDAIPQLSSTGGTTGAMAYYDNNSEIGAEYGGLYNWYAVDDPRGLCPSGWMVADQLQWQALVDFAGNQAQKLRITSPTYPDWQGTNEFEFAALPGGQYGELLLNYNLADPLTFENLGTEGTWWTSTEQTWSDDWYDAGTAAVTRRMQSYLEPVFEASRWKEMGFSVRCTHKLGSGCTDPVAWNFNPSALVDDGSCDPCGYPVSYQGYDYATVFIGNQCWFAENLCSENYENGDAIPAGLSDNEWEYTSSGAVAVYGEGSAPCLNNSPDGDACDEAWSLNEYGRLYNWYAVDDARGLCPSGWHVPTDGDWMTMEMALGMSESEASGTGWRGTDQGLQMKTNYGWLMGGNGTNSSGFAGLPGGFRYDWGLFTSAGAGGYWWSSSPDGSSAWYRFLDNDYEDVNRVNGSQRAGLSVRCVRDAE